MNFFCKNKEFIKKLLIIAFLTAIIILLIIGRFRTMRIRIVGCDCCIGTSNIR